MERLGSDEPLTGLKTSMDQPLQSGVSVTAENWRTALDKVVPAVIVLRTTTCRGFDTESPSCSSATGFVVDKRRGIILTNRHVVGPGPVVAEAMFANSEEIPVYPIYRDPVHDFGFFRYDPLAIQFLSYEEIPLAPEAACVGLEIRVVGNDSGEKVSILAGTIARLDRDAPRYKKDGYNDFNTFYLQAASGTKGGSSGSPVIDWQGRAIAMNAGGRADSASAFYLPLERVVRALKLLQKRRDINVNNWEASTIPRGTLQVTFLHKGFDETRRLGVRSETEQLVRNASPIGETGMLVVDLVVPDGPADNHLEAGDVLVRLNGEVTTQFLKMENLLDESVNNKIELEIERGGKSLTFDLTVQDLHSVTPDYFFEISGAVIHPLSYQQARNFRLRCGLAYVADQGYMLYRAGVPKHAIIKKFAGEDISNVEDLISALSKLTTSDKIPLEYMLHDDRHLTKSVLVTVDRHEWYGPPRMYTRNDVTGLWTIKQAFPLESPLLSFPNDQNFANNGVSSESCEVTLMEQASEQGRKEHIGSAPSMRSAFNIFHDGPRYEDKSNTEVATGSIVENLPTDGVLISESCVGEPMKDKLNDLGKENKVVCNDRENTTDTASNDSVVERVIEPALVMVEVNVPWSCMIDGVHEESFSGTGVVIYHSESMGLVAVDRNTVPVSISDVMLSFAVYPIEVHGKVVFLHPTHNFALVSYDPSSLGAGASLVRPAELLPEPFLRRGDSVYLVGLDKGLQLAFKKSVITNACATLDIRSAKNPRYRATNMEYIELDNDLSRITGGVLTDELGRVQAIWGSFSTVNSSSKDSQFDGGIPIHNVNQILNKIIYGPDTYSSLINGIKMPVPLVRMLEVELRPTVLSKARSFGLSDTWIQVLMKKDSVRRQVLRVKRCLSGTEAENLLVQGDMVLAVNKEPVTCFRDIEDACLELDQRNDGDGKLKLTIFRQGEEIDIVVGTNVRDGNGTTRLVNWCGCITQDPHPAVRAVGFLPKEGHGVYVSRWYNGSPVPRYGLVAGRWIVEVNGMPTPTLDVFVDVIKELEHGQFVRLRTIDLSGKPQVFTLKQDLHYWPTWELRFEPETALWRRRTIKAL